MNLLLIWPIVLLCISSKYGETQTKKQAQAANCNILIAKKMETE